MNFKIAAAATIMAGVFITGLTLRPKADAAPPAPSASTLPSPATPREAPLEVPVAPPREIIAMPEETPTQEAPPVAENPPAAAPTAEAPPAQQAELSAPPAALLDAAHWDARVPATQRAALIVVSEMKMYILEGRRVLWSATCATATNGLGSEARSQKTPLGWHQVAEKIGDGAPYGQVFRSRVATKERWKPGMSTKEDLVLTRVLWLDGLEPGKNKGKNASGITVDSKERCIYIHGTNGESALGTPSSHGCIRLSNTEVIKAFDLLPANAPVLIAE